MCEMAMLINLSLSPSVRHRFVSLHSIVFYTSNKIEFFFILSLHSI